MVRIRNVCLLLLCTILQGRLGAAQTVTLTLLQDLTSKLPSGTAFQAKDSGGKIYTGHVVTRPAKRFLRRGSLMLVFDEPVVPRTKDPEAVFRASNKVRLVKLGASLGAAKLADDLVDTSIGATKARYVAAGVAAALILFQKGGEAKLREGTTIDVEPRERSLPGVQPSHTVPAAEFEESRAEHP